MTTSSKSASSAAPSGMESSAPGPLPMLHSPSEVAWMFVREYYHHLNREPSRLHLFYSKESAIIHGLEGVHVDQVVGQSNIQKLMSTINYKDARVVVSNVDSQLSSNNGVMVQVLGELSNNNKPSQKFVQSFFLAKQPAGYFVLNDIFRYLCEEDMDDQIDQPPGSSIKEEPHVPKQDLVNPDESVKKPKEVVKQSSPKSREDSPGRVSDPVIKKLDHPTTTTTTKHHEPIVSQDVRAMQKDLPVKKEVVGPTATINKPVHAVPATPTTWAQLARSNAGTPASSSSTPPSHQHQPKQTDHVEASRQQSAASPKPTQQQQQSVPLVTVHGHENVQIVGNPGMERMQSGSIHQEFDKSVWMKLTFPQHTNMPADFILQSVDSKEVQVKSLMYNKMGAVMQLSSVDQAKMLIGRRFVFNDREILVEPRKLPMRDSGGRYNNPNGHYGGRGYNRPPQQDQFGGGGGGGGSGRGGGNRNSTSRGGGGGGQRGGSGASMSSSRAIN